MYEDSGSQSHLKDYYHRLEKRKWLILGCLFITLLLTAVLTFSMKPIFRASAAMVIGEEQAVSPLTGEVVNYGNYVSEELTFQTHFEAVSSRPVLEKVITALDLGDGLFEMDPVGRFVANVRGNLETLLARLSPQEAEEKDALSEEARQIAAKIEALKKKISIKQVRGTRLLRIEVEDNDPALARDIANSLAESYILYDTEVRLEGEKMIMRWLDKQLSEMKHKVEVAERNFQEFKEQENLFSIKNKQKINVDKIEEMNTAYLEARSKRLEVETKISELKRYIEQNKAGKIRNIPIFLNNKLLEDLFSELLSAEIEYNRLSDVYKKKHPEIIKIQSTISGLTAKIHQQIQKALDNAGSELSMLLAREKALLEAMKHYEQEAIATNRKELRYAILEREVQTNRQLYELLLGRLKESEVLGEVTKSNLRLVEPASTPDKPVKPKKAFNLAVGAMLGLLLGIGLALFNDYMDQTLHNRTDIEKHLGLQVLSEVPVVGNGYGMTGKSKRVFGPSVLDLPLNSRFTEAFRILVSRLRFSELNRRKGVYVVTSSAPHDGKSTTAFNLGLTMAMQGVRTILIEADMRLPKTRKSSALYGRPGLADVLTDALGTEVSFGRLGETAVGDIHTLLAVQERTGLLKYRTPREMFEVAFLDGRIVDVDWSGRPPGARLGALLVRSGRITEEQGETALAMQRNSSQRLGQILLRLGLLSADDLAGPLKMQMQQNLTELYRCQEAEYVFLEDKSVANGKADLKEMELASALGHVDAGISPPTPFLFRRINRCLVQVKGESLWVMTTGKSVPNPMDLLTSKRMRVLVDLLKQHFDMVILDAPPAVGMSDATVLADMAEGVVLVIRADRTPVTEALRAKEQLETVETPIVGTVLNMFDMKKEGYYHGRYYYYEYGGYYPKSRSLSRKRRQREGGQPKKGLKPGG